MKKHLKEGVPTHPGKPGKLNNFPHPGNVLNFTKSGNVLEKCHMQNST